MTLRSPGVPRPFAPKRLGLPAAVADALALTHLVRETVTARLARDALHLRLAGLPAGARHGHHQRLVREALEPLLRPARARLYELPNGDTVAVAPPDARHLHVTEERLAILFAHAATPPFQRRRLPEEAAALLAVVEDSLTPSAAAPWPLAEGGPGAARPLSTADLGAMERSLGNASLARFLVWRPVCRLARGDPAPQLAWEEWQLGWPELCAALLPEADPHQSPALVHRLQRLVQRRLLSDAARPEEALRLGQAGVRLSPDILASPEFLRLEAALGPKRRARMTVTLSAEDALGDPAGFGFARDYCRLRGWRVALDVAAPELLPALPAAALGVDFIRLHWSAALPPLAAALPAERGLLVLGGADRAAALGWGWEAGITLFEGRLLRPRG